MRPHTLRVDEFVVEMRRESALGWDLKFRTALVKSNLPPEGEGKNCWCVQKCTVACSDDLSWSSGA